MTRFRVQPIRSFAALNRGFFGAALIAFFALKLARVVDWSWWWVLSPLWISVLPFALAAGLFGALWCRNRRP